MRYSDNIDYLLASITYLGSHTYYWARTPEHMARELSLEQNRLAQVFEGFPGLFRRSMKPAPDSKSNEHFFSLQARYALRDGPGTGEPEQVSYIAPTTTETLQLLIDFVKDQAAREVELSAIETASRNAESSRKVALLAAFAAGLSALISLIGIFN